MISSLKIKGLMKVPYFVLTLLVVASCSGAEADESDTQSSVSLAISDQDESAIELSELTEDEVIDFWVETLGGESERALVNCLVAEAGGVEEFLSRTEADVEAFSEALKESSCLAN